MNASTGMAIMMTALAASALADGVRLGDIRDFRPEGYVGTRFGLCVRNHVMAEDPLMFTRVFHAQGEDHLWQTEFWGKYMHAAAPVGLLVGDPAFSAKVEAGVRDLLSCQLEDGYLGNYRADRRYGGGTWDVWGAKYTMLGLIHHFDATGDKAALAAAERVAANLMSVFGPGKRDLRKSGNYRGMPSCSALEPIVWLYKRTKKAEYLDFAQYIRGEMDAEDGARLLRDANLPVFARVTEGSEWSGSSLKAYEMMSCYQGLLELHDVTGEKALLDAALASARSISETEVNIAGGAASAEHWYDGAAKETEVYRLPNETCVVTTWMRLCAKLYEKTGDPRWTDEIEKTFYNIYLATLRPDGSEFSQYCPLAGTRARGEDHCRMKTNCCNANGPRGFLDFIRTGLVGSGDALMFNHYVTGNLSAEVPSLGRKAEFYCYTPYPETGSVHLEYRGREPMEFTLRLRVPAWCPRLDARVGGGEAVSVENKDGAAKYCDLRRQWKQGDFVDFTLPLPVRAHFKNGHVAFTRGPVVLARDLRFADGDIGEVLRPEFASGGPQQAGKEDVRDVGVSFDRIRARNGMWMSFAASLPTGCHSESTTDRLPESVRFCDFASAGGTWDGSSAYRVWLPIVRSEPRR